jgi:acyl carrier protein
MASVATSFPADNLIEDGRIEALVGGLLARKGRAPVGRDANLREAGLSSLDMVNLMLAVEEAFDLALPEQAMTPENFRSVEAIETLVAGLL